MDAAWLGAHRPGRARFAANPRDRVYEPYGLGLDEAALERALALEDPDREVPFRLRPSLNVAQLYEFTGRIDLARGLLVGLREQIVARGEESDLPFVLVHLGRDSVAGRRARSR